MHTDIKLRDLMERISQLQDHELWAMVTVDSTQYRPEAITYARAEISRRGIPVDQIETIRTPTPFKSIITLCNRLVSAIRYRVFHIVCLSTSLFFAWANYKSYLHMYAGRVMDHSFVYFGFPFDLYQTGGYAGPTMMLWPGFIADGALAALASLCAGWVFKRLVAKAQH